MPTTDNSLAGDNPPLLQPLAVVALPDPLGGDCEPLVVSTSSVLGGRQSQVVVSILEGCSDVGKAK